MVNNKQNINNTLIHRKSERITHSVESEIVTSTQELVQLNSCSNTTNHCVSKTIALAKSSFNKSSSNSKSANSKTTSKQNASKSSKASTNTVSQTGSSSAQSTPSSQTQASPNQTASASKSTNASASDNDEKPTLSKYVIDHLSGLNFTSITDLSDLYSKIGTKSSNVISNSNKYKIDTSDKNLIIMRNKKVFKEYESKNDFLYAIILKDSNDPDVSVDITYRIKKQGKSKMTIEQLYSCIKYDMEKMEANIRADMATKEDLKAMATKEDLEAVKQNMATKDDLKALEDGIRADMATKDDVKELETNLRKEIKIVDEKVDDIREAVKELQCEAKGHGWTIKKELK